jgi:aerobic carbon-monoxide dehydrogenase small subunit
MHISIKLNGVDVASEIEPRLLLVHWIRESAGETGTHWGCDTSNCGACVVWLDGKPAKSCTVLAAMADGHEVTTVEALEKGGVLDPIQQGFMECHGLQCGFCTPGMMMTSRALLDQNPNPSEEEIRDGLSGQLCRCTGYDNIVKAVQWAAAHPAEAAKV